MHGRRADPRVGYFESGRFDFSNDLQRTPRQRFVNRWRLEKKDPDAALSEPVKPIVFWIDRTVPVKYRAAITAGVLEWNKAFEKIGFKDAIRVEVQPDDADFDTLDFGRASIRWMTNAVAGLRRHRPEPRRPAQRRDPRRRHRHREPVVAQHPHRALADPVGDRRRQPVPRRRSDAAASSRSCCRAASAPTARSPPSR